MHTPREIWQLDTAHIGRAVWVFDELPSTNDTAAELSANPDHDGVAVLAEHQTAGRGQYGRVWQSRPGLSALMSVLIFPPVEFRRPPVLIAWAAVALAETLTQRCQVRPSIKWPNDLLVNGKKICGILTEQRSGESLSTIVGIGLNVNQTSADFAEAGLTEATSIFQLTGLHHELRPLVTDVLRRLDAWYGELQMVGLQRLENEWVQRLGFLGRHVRVELADGTHSQGRVRAMTFDGLELEFGDGAFTCIRLELIRHVRW